MKTILCIALITAFLSGCSFENPVEVTDNLRAQIEPQQVIAIAKQSESPSDEPLWIVSSIGAQLLKNKYERYNEIGLDESDFDRMPDNELTKNVKRLYEDIKQLLL